MSPLPHNGEHQGVVQVTEETPTSPYNPPLRPHILPISTPKATGYNFPIPKPFDEELDGGDETKPKLAAGVIAAIVVLSVLAVVVVGFCGWSSWKRRTGQEEIRRKRKARKAKALALARSGSNETT
ncbi:hypothetical protein BJ508DRAFT_329488 [Ascobolus immersus RN42]|uniref:Uncharacterized protein n=1 Tax=Ascobolus immersus RN42 TaxID=1160509 RepID=A0A3N4HX25_ASCIM|nr:hypothetical protein BJ508DRAFT_329488 [Ascobolus immersus RN42]